MRHATAQRLREIVVEFAKAKKVPFSKYVYRKVKKEYNATPWNLRHAFKLD